MPRLLLLVLRPLHNSGSSEPTGALLLHTPHTQSDQVSHDRVSDMLFHKAISSWCSPVAVAGTVRDDSYHLSAAHCLLLLLRAEIQYCK